MRHMSLTPQTLEDNVPQSVVQHAGTSFVMTCFNCLNTLTGVGILSYPYALSEGGWLSLSTFIFVAAICCYTGILLQRCMNKNHLIRTYPDIGQVSFGNKGRKCISVFLYLELYLVAVEFLILEGDNLDKLFSNVCLRVYGHYIIGGRKIFILFSGLVVLPTTWFRDLSVLAFISAGGVLACVLLVCSVFLVGVDGGVGFHQRGTIWRWSGLPITTSVFMFCYGGHAVFPTLYTSMRDKSQFSKVLLICFFLSTLLYGSMGLIGYLMFGGDALSQITLNLPTAYIGSKVAIYITLVSPLTKYALIISPIARAIEETFLNERGRVVQIIMRTCLVATTIGVAVLVPFFGYVMTFIGACLNVTLAIVFPCLCYLKLNQPSRTFGVELTVIVVIFTFGVCVAVSGTYTSIRSIISHV